MTDAVQALARQMRHDDAADETEMIARLDRQMAETRRLSELLERLDGRSRSTSRGSDGAP